MDEGECDADHVDSDPKDVEYVMAERAVHKWAAGRVVTRFGVRCKSAAQKRRAQVDSDAREPYHERAEKDALENGEGKGRKGEEVVTIISRVDDIVVICYSGRKGEISVKIQKATNLCFVGECIFCVYVYFVYMYISCIYIFCVYVYFFSLSLPFPPKKLHRKLGRNRSVIAFRHLDAKIARVANFSNSFITSSSGDAFRNKFLGFAYASVREGHE